MEIKRAVHNTSVYKHGNVSLDPLVLLVRMVQLRSFRRYYGLRDQITWQLRFELMEFSQWKLG